MISRTVRSEYFAVPCGTTPTWARHSRSSFCGSRPSTLTVPLVRRCAPVRMSMVVVLPAPLGPRKANTSPLSTCRSTLSTATKLPYAFLNPLTVMALDITNPPSQLSIKSGGRGGVIPPTCVGVNQRWQQQHGRQQQAMPPATSARSSEVRSCASRAGA